MPLLDTKHLIFDMNLMTYKVSEIKVQFDSIHFTFHLTKIFFKSLGPQLKVVSTMSVGFDHVDCSALKKRNVLLGNTPDVLTDATVRFIIRLILSFISIRLRYDKKNQK